MTTAAPASICKIVLRAVSETFETMIFTQVAPLPAAQESPSINQDIPGNPPELIQKIYWTTIPVLSPLQGHMLMEIPDPLAVELTKNLYGWIDDSQVTEKVKQDALAELINTISGRLMDMLLPADQTFELGLPVLIDGSPELNAENVLCRFAAAEEKFTFILTDQLASVYGRNKG